MAVFESSKQNKSAVSGRLGLRRAWAMPASYRAEGVLSQYYVTALQGDTACSTCCRMGCRKLRLGASPKLVQPTSP